MEHAFSREGVPIERREDYPDEATAARLHRELSQTWYVPRGLIGWFSVVDHRTVGRRYLITAFCFFICAGINIILIDHTNAIKIKPPGCKICRVRIINNCSLRIKASVRSIYRTDHINNTHKQNTIQVYIR